MIVADTNLIAYLFIPGEFTNLAEHILKRDKDWSVPILWRSEFRNVLSVYLRANRLSLQEVYHTMKMAEEYFCESEYTVSSEKILDTVSQTDLSAYDAEYVSLAKELKVNLITSDKKILKEAEGVAVSMKDFIV